MITIKTSSQSLNPLEFENLIETYRLSLPKNYKISVSLKNPIHHLAALYACLIEGKRVFSENSFHSDSEKLSARDLFKPESIIDTMLNPLTKNLVTKSLSPDSLLAIATSGSSGNSKVVLIKPKALIASAQASCEFYKIKQDDLVLSPLPLNHIGGLLPLWRALHSSSSLMLAVNGQWQSALSEEAQFISLVPAQLQELIHTGFNWNNFKAVILGGQAVDKKLFQLAIQKSIPISLSYGSSESVAILSATKPLEPFNGSVGKPLSKREIKVIDDKLCFKGEACFYGYQDNTSDNLPFDDDGFFHTQDLAQVIKGEIVIKGRADFIYKSGGENINPIELQQSFIEKTSLEGCVISPLSDNQFGNINAALISPRSKDLINEVHLVNNSLPAFKKIRFLSTSWPADSGLKLKSIQVKEIIDSNFSKWNLKQLNSPLKNKPDLVFLHGFMGDSNSLKVLALQFTNDFNIWSLDLPHHGNHLKHEYECWNDVIDELACLLIRFSNLWIYGYSMGGRLALGLLDRYPNFINKLILEGTNPGLKTDEEKRNRVQFENSIINKMSHFNDFLTEWYKADLFKLTDVEISKLIAMTPNIPKSYQAALKTFGLSSQPDYSTLVKHHKVMAICGEFDEKYQSLWPECLVIKDCSHKASFQDPTQVSRLVLERLAL